MSIEQQPPTHQNIPVEHLPPFPHNKADTIIPPVEHRDKKKGMSLKTKLGLVLASVGIAGTAGMVGKSMGGSEPAATPDRSPAASATPNPGEQEPQGKTTEFGISAAEYQANPEQLVKEYYSQLNEYFIAGATEEAATADERYSMGDDEYVAAFSAPVDEAFISNLFVTNWESDANLTEYVNSLTYIANTTRRVRLNTYVGGVTEENQPYVRETILDEIITSEKPLTTSVRWHEQDNRDVNNAENMLTGTNPNDETGGETLTWSNENGQLKISGIAHYDG